MIDLDKDFENEVRRIARAKWPCAEFCGAEMIDGQERDGVFETEDTINFIEATVSGGAGKAKDDARKIFKTIVAYNKSGSLKTAIGWFVTKNEPTADQRKAVSENGKGQVKAVSFAQFQQSLVDVRAYLAARNDHHFGSVRDFDSSEKKHPTVPFVEIGLTPSSSNTTISLNEIVESTIRGCKFSITGQYGAGKSMILKEIFNKISEKYIKGTTSKFPVYINLRDHSGQKDPIEILERHARGIGFPSPASLIRAWRAGFCVLLVDGFDEVASLGVQGSWKRLKDLRYRSLEGIRKLVKECGESGVIVTGRSHYFENETELCSALGLENPTIFSIDEFNEAQIREFLSKFGISRDNISLPNWLPTRPLLIGYLAAKGVFNKITDDRNISDAADGWNYLLSQIYTREQGIEFNLDGETLRLILERASTIARVSEEQLGPISRVDLFTAFSEVCGYEPDEQGILAIQRLPGLGLFRAEDESRCFVDKELAAVCCGREFSRFLENPHQQSSIKQWSDTMNTCDRPISKTGLDVAIRYFSFNNLDLLKFTRESIIFLNKRTDLKCAKGDVAALLMHGNIKPSITFHVSEVGFYDSHVEFYEDSIDFHNLQFSHCLFENVLLASNTNQSFLPYFDTCLFYKINGRLSKNDLPSDRFINCEYVDFDSAKTSESIRSTSLSTPEKVLLITLRKLFIQSLSGRQEGALFRGLDLDERRHVPAILRLLKKHGLAIEYSRSDSVIWLPTKKAIDRAKLIIAAPAECGETIVGDVRKLAN